jgi:hypothetical protein
MHLFFGINPSKGYWHGHPLSGCGTEHQPHWITLALRSSGETIKTIYPIQDDDAKLANSFQILINVASRRIGEIGC